MKKILLILLGVIGGLYYLNMQTANSIEGNSDVDNVSETLDSKLVDTAQIASDNKHYAKNTVKDHDPQPAKLETDPSVQNVDPKTISESKGLSNKAVNRVVSNEVSASQVQALFEREEIHAERAHYYEFNIYKTFFADKNSDIDVSRIECRTSLCKITINSAGKDKTVLGNKVSAVLSETPWSKGASTYIHNSASGNSVVVMLSVYGDISDKI